MPEPSSRRFSANAAWLSIGPRSRAWTSCSQALGDDQVGRFASAEQLVAGKPGIEALIAPRHHRARVERRFHQLSRAFSTSSENDAEFEVKRLHDEARVRSSALTEAEGQSLEQNQKNAAFDAKAKLRRFRRARPGVICSIASVVVDQALRQFPKDPMTYRVAAYLLAAVSRVAGFRHGHELVRGQSRTKDAGLVYLRALEALNRRRVPAAMRRRCSGKRLRLDPKMVRAQAKLVLARRGHRRDVSRVREPARGRAPAPDGRPAWGLPSPATTSCRHRFVTRRPRDSHRQPLATGDVQPADRRRPQRARRAR